jgi:hypothetical protein
MMLQLLAWNAKQDNSLIANYLNADELQNYIM